MRRLPLSLVLAIFSAIITLICGIPRMGIGLLLGIPVAMCQRFLSRLGLKQIGESNNITSVIAVLKWSLLRLILAFAALAGAWPFGPQVMLGILLTMVFEMGTYIGTLWLMTNKPLE
jgi:hypothetical protein